MPEALTIRLTGPSFVASLVPQFGLQQIIDWSFVSGLTDELPYRFPNYHGDAAIRQTQVPLGAWRGINYTQNAFYRESFIDELAHAAGIDPYQYRRRLARNSPKNPRRARCRRAKSRTGIGRCLPVCSAASR